MYSSCFLSGLFQNLRVTFFNTICVEITDLINLWLVSDFHRPLPRFVGGEFLSHNAVEKIHRIEQHIAGIRIIAAADISRNLTRADKGASHSLYTTCTG